VETIEAIRTATKYSAYYARAFPTTPITEILKAAMSAPSAGNQQPWPFLIITDRGLCEEIATFHPYAQMVRRRRWRSSCAETWPGKLQGILGAGLLPRDAEYPVAAHAKGLARCGWASIRGRPSTASETPTCDPGDPLALVPGGHSGGTGAPAHRFDPARIHRNRW